MNKRKILVLSIGFTIILITFIVFFSYMAHDMITESDKHYKVIIVPFYVFFIFPIILEELSLLRSVYKLICFNSTIVVKICYVISVIIVLATLIFQLLVFTGVITAYDLFTNEAGKAADSRFLGFFLVTEWLAVFVSFILGSFTSKQSSI